MSGVSTYFSLLDNIDSSEWAEMGPEEQIEYLQNLESLKEAEPEEISELYDQMAELIETFKDERDRFEDVLDENDATESQIKRAERLLEELDEQIAATQDLKKDVSKVVKENKKWEASHNLQFNGEDGTIKDIEVGTDIEENTYTIDVGNQTSDIFAVDNMSDEAYLVRQRVIRVVNGQWEVIKDVVNDHIVADGKMNQDDITAALKDKNDILTAQKIFLSPPAGLTFTQLVSYDSFAGEATLKLEDAEGNSAYLILKNMGKANLQYTAGVTAEFAKILVDNNEDFSKICFFKDDENSFYENLRPSADLPLDQQLGVIKGYRAVKDGLAGSLRHISGGLTEPQQNAAKKVIDSLFGYINDSSAIEVTEFWNEAEQLLRDAGIMDPVEKSKILQVVTFAMAENAPHLFTQLFGPVAPRLESILVADTIPVPGHGELVEPSASAKAALLLINMKAMGTPGNFGGTQMFKLYYPDTTLVPPVLTGFKDVVSIRESLKIYKTIVNQMDGVFGESLTGADVDKIINLPDSMTTLTTKDGTTVLNDPDDGADHSSEYDNAQDEFSSEWANNQAISTFIDDPTDWPLFMSELTTRIFTPDGELVEDPFYVIYHWLRWEGGHTVNNEWVFDMPVNTDYDDVIAQLIVWVDEHCSDKFKKAFFAAINKDENATKFLNSETVYGDEYPSGSRGTMGASNMTSVDQAKQILNTF